MESQKKNNVKLRYYICLMDTVYTTFFPRSWMVGDLDKTRFSHGEGWVEITSQQFRELSKIITKLNRIDKQQEECYTKDRYCDSPIAWRFSRKLDALAIEERTLRKRYEQKVYEFTSQLITLFHTPRIGGKSLIE